MFIVFHDNQSLGLLRFGYPCIIDCILCCPMTKAEGQVKSTPNAQPLTSAQALQPVAAAPTALISSVGTLTRSRFHWYHAVFAVGLLAVSGAGTVVLVKVSKILYTITLSCYHTVMLVILLMPIICFPFPKDGLGLHL